MYAAVERCGPRADPVPRAFAVRHDQHAGREAPVSAARPPDGTVTVSGWVRPTQTRGALGPSDPDEGRLVTMSRVDIDRIQQQVPYELEPVYLSLLDDLDGDLPIPAPALRTEF